VTCGRLVDIVDNGYDPRGSTTDHYKGRCKECSAIISFSVGGRENYEGALASELSSRQKYFCQKPEKVREREKKKLEDQIEDLQSKLRALG
jgi:hypothetical protein